MFIGENKENARIISNARNNPGKVWEIRYPYSNSGIFISTFNYLVIIFLKVSYYIRIGLANH
jgi:hypothetical protein